MNNRQQRLLNLLANPLDETIVAKRAVNLKDIAALQQATRDEFTILTRGGQRLVIRGQGHEIPGMSVARAEQLAQQGWRWSGHTHPYFDIAGITESSGDLAVLKAFYEAHGQWRSSILSVPGQGNVNVFELRGLSQP